MPGLYFKKTYLLGALKLESSARVTMARSCQILLSFLFQMIIGQPFNVSQIIGALIIVVAIVATGSERLVMAKLPSFLSKSLPPCPCQRRRDPSTADGSQTDLTDIVQFATAEMDDNGRKPPAIMAQWPRRRSENSALENSRNSSPAFNYRRFVSYHPPSLSEQHIDEKPSIKE